MARTTARLEDLDDHHAAAALRTGMVEVLGKERVLASPGVRWQRGRRSELRCRSDELASAGELLGALGAAIGEQAVMADAVEAPGQDVHEEPANELAGSSVMVVYRSGPSMR